MRSTTCSAACWPACWHAVRGPSTWPATHAPVTLDGRLASLVDEHVPDSEDGQRTALRHHLARRLLDDPVVYFDALDDAPRAYFANQRGAMATRLCEATGLVPEQRAEGLALVDEDGALTDVAMPAEGTEAHATLLVAEFLAGRQRVGAAEGCGLDEIAAFIAEARKRYGNYWRKSAREPGAEHELARTAVQRLAQLRLISTQGEQVRTLPALARFALGETELRAAAASSQNSLFDAA